jgi:hypothetical protein
MKTKFIFPLLLIFVYSYSQDKSTEWKYPIEVGSTEWRETSYKYKIDKSQPPKAIISEWNTRKLFLYCLDYPFNKVMLMFNNPDKGFKKVFEESLVWQSFIKRADAVDVFVDYYANDSYTDLFSMADNKNGMDKYLNMFFLEKIVSETDFAENMKTIDRKKITKAIFSNHIDKINYPDYFLGYTYNSSLCALLKVLESDSFLKANQLNLSEFKKVTNQEYYVDTDIEKKILEVTIKYLEK